MTKINKLWIILIGSVGLSANAQQETKTYTQVIDSLLTYINKQPIKTGILYDRIYPFADLKTEKDSIISDYDHFLQSWHELHTASYNPDFKSTEQLREILKADTTEQVYIGIINTRMNYLDYGTELLPNFTFLDGYLRNIIEIDPVRNKQVTVIAPLKEWINTGTVTFSLTNDFILQKTGIAIKKLEADFGNGTLYTLINNGTVTQNSVTVNIDNSGIKTIVFKATFADNSTAYYYAVMDVQPAYIPPPVSTAYPLEEDFVGSRGIMTYTTGNTETFQGYNENTPSKGILEYRTYYNYVTNDGAVPPKIAKPIIVLDGFDPGDKRKIYPGSQGYNSDRDYSSLYELMVYDPYNDNDPDNDINLVKQLREAPYGFDVTLVNFPNGADYIERNAMAVVALLKRENEKLRANGSQEEIIIIGPSMGGLIARYALAYMEKNNIQHKRYNNKKLNITAGLLSLECNNKIKRNPAKNNISRIEIKTEGFYTFNKT